MRLDPSQQAAVDYDGGALLIVAGAGSGKTRTLTQRAIRQIQCGVAPDRLLMLTFSRKACREMADRVGASMADRSVMPLITTYHAFGYRLLRERPDLCSRRPNPTLMDEADHKKLFKAALKANGVVEKSAFKAIASFYDMSRNAGADFENFDHRQHLMERAAHAIPLPGYIDEIFDAFAFYEQQKRLSNIVDFNDLQILPLFGLKNNPQWLKDVASRYHELSIDETQDTSTTQYRFVFLLGRAMDGRVVMVGDDDQCIYGWRGAKASNMERFVADFNAHQVHLSTNYRSKPLIVESASALIGNNEVRLSKSPKSARAADGDGFVVLKTHDDGQNMARHIAMEINAGLADGNVPGDFAVLYRTNWMAKLLEPELLALGIPYTIKKGMELNRRQEIQMLFSLLRLVINGGDAPAFARVAMRVPGLGEKRVQSIIEHAEGDLLATAKMASPNNKEYQTAIDDLIYGVNFLRMFGAADMRTPDDWYGVFPMLLPWITKLSESANEPSANLATRMQAVESICAAIAGRIATFTEDMTPVDQWASVQEMGLASPDDETDPIIGGSVTLTTVHGSKGLEWPHVHVAGFSEGLMPMSRKDATAGDLDDDDGVGDIEEERRTAYVAITRAADSLTLHHADRIFVFGSSRNFVISRFVNEAKRIKIDRSWAGDGD
ncbi:MAG: ATP-dependent helicase [Halothiobacillus sp.]|nr:ATP-dependent helicase [Halothiobacillus sp.]